MGTCDCARAQRPGRTGGRYRREGLRGACRKRAAGALVAASAGSTAASDTQSFRALALSYLKPRPLGAFLLGISSGFPLTLLIWTMSYWLSKVGVDKQTIGFAF